MTTDVLLLDADYYGTLAAARCYGRQGMTVTIADPRKHRRASHSRHVTATEICPPLSMPYALVDWLVRWGEAHPGTLLYPSSDHLAWLFAVFRERLGAVFVMYSPTEDAVMTLLDKQRLHDVCAHPDVGIEVPATGAVCDAGEEAAAIGRVRYPVILKPRTQVMLESGVKGIPVRDRSALPAALARFRTLVRYSPALTDRYPGVSEPMVQEYLTAAETSIVSVSGFVGQDGTIVARASMKVLQYPRKMGIGLCFEGRPLDAALVAKLSALCRHVGYYGTFEAEFVADGDRRLLIDFNPRYYSQMGFDIARNLPLPLLVSHAARGEHEALHAALVQARAWTPTGSEIYVHKRMFDFILGLQGLSGAMSRDDVRSWRHWYQAHRTEATDAVHDPDDRRPAMADAALWMQSFAQHPRSFVRSFVLNR